MSQLLLRSLMVLAVSLVLSISARTEAATYNWNGTGNWNATGPWGGTLPGSGDTGIINTGTATANVVLAGAPSIFISNTATLIHPAIAGTTPLAGSITVQSGGTINWTGTAADLTPIIFEGGSFLSRTTSNLAAIISSPISFNSGIITAANLVGTVYGSAYSPTLVGPITGSAQLHINPSLASQKSSLAIGPTTANAFTGSVVISGTSDAQGTLVLKGTGALKNASAVTLNPYGTLRINAATDPLKANLVVNVPAGARMEWGGIGNYTYAAADLPKIVFADGANFGREDGNALSTSKENIQINSGVTVHANMIRGTVTGNSYLLTLGGPLTGSGNLIVKPLDANYIGPLQIAPTVANTFNGNVTVDGTSAAKGTLVLGGTGALKNVSTLTLNPNGILRINAATDALKANLVVNVPVGARMEWGGIGNYTYAAADLPKIVFADGANFGREDSNLLATSRENIQINSGVTVHADMIKGYVTGNSYLLTLGGPLTGSGNLIVKPLDANYIGPLQIAPTVSNTFSGNVTVDGTSAAKGTLALGGTGALRNVSALTVTNNGILRFNTGTDALPDNFAVNIAAGGRVEWGGTTNYTNPALAPTINFGDGATISRIDSNLIVLGREKIHIGAGITAIATDITGTLYDNTYALTLAGPMSGSGTLRVAPTLTTHRSTLRLAPTAANSFNGNVEITGNSDVRGYLSLAGTGALANVNSITLDQYAALRFNAATNPLPDNFLLNVPTGAGIEWTGTSVYSGITPPTLQFQDGTFISRSENNVISTVREKISLVSGATVTVKDLNGTLLQQGYGVTITGAIVGDDTTTLRVKTSTATSIPIPSARLGVLTINPTTPNTGFAGNVVVESEDATYRSILILNGNQPLGTGTVDILANSIVSVGTNGALNGVTGVNVENGGSLRFRVTGGSTLDNAELSGNGVVRSEITLAGTNNQQDDYTLQSLTLNNTVLSPGNSAGTLTFQATTLTLGAGTVLQAELGMTSDVLAVTGNLVLTAGSTLEISDLEDLAPGTHIIATYSGTLTGEFGSLVNNLGSTFLFGSINYGTGLNSFISVDIAATPAPEPNTGLLAGLGMLGAMIVRRRKQRRDQE